MSTEMEEAPKKATHKQSPEMKDHLEEKHQWDIELIKLIKQETNLYIANFSKKIWKLSKVS